MSGGVQVRARGFFAQRLDPNQEGFGETGRDLALQDGAQSSRVNLLEIYFSQESEKEKKNTIKPLAKKVQHFSCGLSVSPDLWACAILEAPSTSSQFKSISSSLSSGTLTGKSQSRRCSS